MKSDPEHLEGVNPSLENIPLPINYFLLFE